MIIKNSFMIKNNVPIINKNLNNNLLNYNKMIQNNVIIKNN